MRISKIMFMISIMPLLRKMLLGSALYAPLRPRYRGTTGVENDDRTLSSMSASITNHPVESVIPTTNAQQVAIIGAGAVGCYYGARLHEMGHNVTFHMRGNNLQACRKSGLIITSIHGDIRIEPNKLQAIGDLRDMNSSFDWILVALKTTSLSDLPALIEPILSPHTRVLLIMNGLIEDDVIAMLKSKLEGNNNSCTSQPLRCCRTLYGGMAFICCNRLAPGRVDHSFAGVLEAGVASSTSNEDEEAFINLFAGSKVETKFSRQLLRSRWLKNIWNLPFNGLSTALGGITVDHIVQERGLREVAELIMDETIAVANADLERRLGHGNFEPLGADDEKERMMRLTDAMGPYRTSTMIDLLSHRSMEVEYLFRKPLERAKEANIATPVLKTIVEQIAYRQKVNNLF